MKYIYSIAVLLLAAISLSAQNRFEQRYNLLVSKLGPAGVGIETLLDNWAKADSTDEKLLAARFDYYLVKSRSTEVVKKTAKKYLGMDPLLSLKDSLGADVYYYQDVVYDDELFGKAIRAADRAISLYPDKLEYRFMKSNAYISYEKESPDMALAYLLSLVDENVRRKSSWTYEDEKVDQAFFQDAMQEYCFSFYSIETPAGYEAFRTLSEKLLMLFPDNTDFVNNLGSYYLIAKEDYKTAYKYYDEVLKKHPDDYTAIKNSILAARKQKNQKLEKKYLEMMVKYGPENERLQAQGRLAVLKK
jgi:tetratricopeptide (TPR) repeat protein